MQHSENFCECQDGFYTSLIVAVLLLVFIFLMLVRTDLFYDANNRLSYNNIIFYNRRYCLRNYDVLKFSKYTSDLYQQKKNHK